MNKQKKVFGISKSLSTGLSETINAVKNHAGMFRYEVIALSRIETDPDNPRDLLITVEDIIQGIDKNSPHYEKKSNEFESLKSLSETIKAKGIINPVVVYPFQNKYRLVAGERRFLASHVAGKQDIQAKVLDEKPNKLNLRQLQWIENTEREDLSLKDRLVNIKLIVDEYQQEKGHCKMTSLLLKDLIGVSTQQANNYLVAITASDDLLEQINLEKINSLDKAAFIERIESSEMRKKLIEMCINGASLNELKVCLSSIKKTFDVDREKKLKPGRISKRVNLGFTNKVGVIKRIVEAFLAHHEEDDYQKIFSSTDWSSYSSVTQVFRRFIQKLEQE